MSSDQNSSHTTSGWWITLLPVVCLLPFLNKAFHIDDTVYLYVAQQIQHAPWDFFGFQMNWVRETEWVHEFNRNPPGISFYFALVGAVFGYSEFVMHASVLVPVFLCALGTYRLVAGRGAPAGFATASALLSPAFLVSSSNLMCEPFVLACYVWSVERWVYGTDANNRTALVVGAALAGLGVWMKFVGVTVVPLLAAYSLIHHRGWNRAIGWLALPIGMTLFYELYVTAAYGQSALFGAATFAADRSTMFAPGAILREAAITLSFLGGSFLPAILAILFMKRWTWSALAGAIAILLGVIVVGAGGLDDAYRLYDGDGMRVDYFTHLIVFIAAGAVLIAMAVSYCYEKRDATGVVVLCWIGGITVFCGFVNWTVNVRALLPMAPAIALLVGHAAMSQSARWRHHVALGTVVIGTGLSVALVHFDARYANLDRESAERIIADLEDESEQKWFQGHWGFQWYMESGGFTHVDLAGVTPQDMMGRDDLTLLGLYPGNVVVSKSDDKLIELSPPVAEAREPARAAMALWGATMNREAGAGFYDSYYGEIPYFLGNVTHPSIEVHEIKSVNAEALPKSNEAVVEN